MLYSFIKKNDYDKDKFEKFVTKNGIVGLIKFFNKYDIHNIINKPFLEKLVEDIISFFDKESLEILLNNDDILDLFIYSNKGNSIVYYDFSINICRKVLNRYLELDIDVESIINLFRCFDEEVQISLLDDIKDRSDILSGIIDFTNFKIISKILNEGMIDLSSSNIDIENLFLNGKEDYIDSLKDKYETGINNNYYSLSPNLLTEEFMDRIWNEYNIFKIRNIINNSIYVTNSTIINNYIKTKEDEMILESSKGYLLPLYQSLFDKYKLNLDINGMSGEINKDYFSKIYAFNSRLRKILSPLEDEVFGELDNYDIDNEEDLYAYVKLLNDEMVSNYIIDYHFAENYYNVMLDLKEILSFYDRGNVELDKEHIRIYREIIDIDKYSIEDKVKLHLELKKYNIMEMFYDDMLECRKIVNNDIKDNTLNRETIKKYYNEELSNLYGVTIYTIKDVELCALVKSSDLRSCSDLKYHNEIPTGYSYSLVGNKLLGTYKPYQVENFVYDTYDLNPNQIMHIYPEDSYTTPAIYGSDESSSERVNKLLLSKELLESETDYSEILVLEEGSVDLPINKDIPNLPILALYCYDYVIPPYTISYAIRNNYSILFVENTYDIRITQGSRINMEDTDNIYFSGCFSDKYNEDRRKSLSI